VSSTAASSDVYVPPLARRIAADLRRHPEIPGEAVAMESARVQAAGAAGYADRATKEPLTVDTPFRIASVTKTFVAATVLKLTEQGRVDLDAPIDRYLSPATIALLGGDGYDTGAITVRHLLGHTAGLFDYAGSVAYDDRTTADPGHVWTPQEQLRFAVDHGDPLADPGREFHYSDTGYVLVGEILERVTGTDLPTAVRTTLDFAGLGLDHTWWEGLEAAPAGLPPLAHQYYGREFDGANLDPSYDLFGGGGLVSTVGDVTTFFRALFDGRVLQPAGLRAMTTVSTAGRSDAAALGLFRHRIAGTECWGHPGYWGTVAYACPDLDLAFAITTNQADESAVDTTPLERAVVRLARRRDPGA